MCIDMKQVHRNVNYIQVMPIFLNVKHYFYLILEESLDF
jgi:hypothetical protein